MARKLTPKKADEWRPVFLGILRETANVRLACEKAGITRASAYAARDRAPDFATAWDTALEEACDLLEGAARQRALVQSDTLLIFLLKAHRPAVYRETSRTEVTGKDGAPLIPDPPAPLTLVELRQMISVLQHAGALDDPE